nr:hypothetical protein [Streptomyces sp. S1D4-11]QIY97201.1 hypothetical protein HEP87_28425 [Streptomyces sp. S1D4-11]
MRRPAVPRGKPSYRILFLIAAPVLPALLAYAVGWVLAAFTVREYPSEVGARRVVEG